jgi:TP901-1 family phage major tail protein
MSAGKGSLVLIKIGNGGSPETFETIGGMRTTRMVINNQLLDSSNRESGPWRKLMGSAGIQSMTISGSGIFVDSNSEEAVRLCAFAASISNYKLYFANGDALTGAFYITSYQRSGEHDDSETYALVLSSAGPIEFTAA